MMRQIQFLVLFLFLALTGFGQEMPEPMSPKRIVNDFTGMFSSQELNALEQKLVNFNNSSSTQISVVTVKSLDGYDINDYAARLGEKWGIGQKGKDNGILVLVKPKVGREKGEVAISVGYGLEGVVPDAIASRIVRNEIIPAFQAGQYYAGVDKATSVLMDLSKGEYTADQYVEKSKGGFPFVILFALLFFILPLFTRRRRGYTAGSSTAAGVPPIFFGGFGGGGSSFGSFSGGSGGFGGFGGGGFGGGGASGSW